MIGRFADGTFVGPRRSLSSGARHARPGDEDGLARGAHDSAGGTFVGPRIREDGLARHARQAGFALLEAIVAITLLAVAMVPIYGLMASTISGAYRVAEVNRGAEAEESALEVLRAVNPMETAEGTIDLGAYHVSWRATPAADPVDGSGYPRGLSLYRMGLFDTEVWASDESGTQLAHFSVKQLGYLRVRDIQIPFTAPRS